MIASRCIFGATLFHKNGDSAYPSTNGRRMRGSRWLVEEEYSAPEIIRGFRSLGERYPWPLAGAALAKGRKQLMADQGSHMRVIRDNLAAGIGSPQIQSAISATSRSATRLTKEMYFTLSTSLRRRPMSQGSGVS